MTVRLYNTLTKQIDELTPLKAGAVSIYSCGPTVYDHVHIGNLSAFIVADILRRNATSHDTDVKHIMNFTDVDDKTIRRSREKYPNLGPKEALKKLTEEYGQLFLDDMRLVGNDTEALTFIKAADDKTIEGMKQLITELHKKGFAYIADDGVYFSIDAYRKSGKTYGQLVEITEQNTSQGRIQNDEYDKESAHDFALWKKQKEGEPAWEFTLDGQELTGRPGWHIECSVMSKLTLGQPFDIHTGGIDLAFPHHENEIAQSTAGEDNPIYASIFVHNEHILVDGKKMSKSLGNFYTLGDLTKQGIDPLVFRLLVLQSHYRKQTNFSLENAKAAWGRMHHWKEIAALRWQAAEEGDPETDALIRQSASDFGLALENDLDTVQALRIVDDLFSKIENLPLSEISKSGLTTFVHMIDKRLGLGLAVNTPNISEEIQQLINEREIARKNKDYEASDKLRDELLSRGVIVKDTADSSIWSYGK